MIRIAQPVTYQIINLPDIVELPLKFFQKSDIPKIEGGIRTKGCYKASLPEKPSITFITVVLNDKNVSYSNFIVNLTI